MTERPIWLRDDGADVRLVNPTSYLTRNIDTSKGYLDPNINKALLIRQRFPEFSNILFQAAKTSQELIAREQIFSRGTPSEMTLKGQKELETRQLKMVEEFVKNIFGSTETFLEWWKKDFSPNRFAILSITQGDITKL